MKLAMSVGGTYRLHQIDGSRWRKWADDSGLDPAWVKACVLALMDHVIRHAVSMRDSLLEDGDHPFIGQLSGCIENRAQKCAELIE